MSHPAPLPGTPSPVRRDALIHAALAAAAAFAVYFGSAPRSVVGEDDALFALAVDFFAPAHPPGYPLYILLAKAFSLLPFGELAFRLHLLSAVLGAAACGLLWQCLRALGLSTVAAYIGALSFAFSATFWSQAIVAEVYTLHSLILFALLHVSIDLRGRHRRLASASAADQTMALRNPLAAFFLLFGLGLCNHWPLLVLSAPAFVILLWPLRRVALAASPRLLTALLVGLMPYLWMYVRIQAPAPPMLFPPPHSAGEFFDFVSRRIVASADTSPTAGVSDKLAFIGFLLSESWRQYSPAAYPLLLLGMLRQYRDKRLLVALVAMLAGPSLLLIGLLGFDYDYLHRVVFRVYPLATYAVFAIWIAVGADYLHQRYNSRPGSLGALVTLALVVLTIALTLIRNLADNSYARDYSWERDYGGTLLAALPADAVLVVSDDIDIGVPLYLQRHAGMRPDVELASVYGAVVYPLFHHDQPFAHPEQLYRHRPFCSTFLRTPARPVTSHLLFHCQTSAAAQDDLAAEGGTLISEPVLSFLERTFAQSTNLGPFVELERRLLAPRLVAPLHASRTTAAPPLRERLDALLQGLSTTFDGGVEWVRLRWRAGELTGAEALAALRELEGRMDDSARKSRRAAWHAAAEAIYRAAGDEEQATTHRHRASELSPRPGTSAAAVK